MSELGDYVAHKVPIVKSEHPEKTQKQVLGQVYGMARDKGLKAAEGGKMLLAKAKKWPPGHPSPSPLATSGARHPDSGQRYEKLLVISHLF